MTGSCRFLSNHHKPVRDLIIYVVIVTIPIYRLDFSQVELWMTFLESLGPVLARKLGRYVGHGASTNDDERKRTDTLHWNRVSDVRHAHQISGESILFRRCEILLAFGLVFN